MDGCVLLDQQAVGRGDTECHCPKGRSLSSGNVFSGEFRGSRENELSERRKQEMAGELLLILSCGTQHSKGFKGYSKM